MGKHLPGIDGLRAFAVLSVVAYHAGLPLPAGFVGVDVFFVISGYVITRMLLAEPAIDLAAFYARRVRRILPALVLVVAVTLALSAALLGPAARVEVTHSAMASMAMAGNVYFQFATGGYFDPVSDEMPLLHLWSLGVEEQFYLAWPLLLMLRRRWLLVALAVLSFVGAVYYTTANQEAAFYQSPLRFWELAVGGLVAMLQVRNPIGRIAAETRVREAGPRERAAIFVNEEHAPVVFAEDGFQAHGRDDKLASRTVVGEGAGKFVHLRVWIEVCRTLFQKGRLHSEITPSHPAAPSAPSAAGSPSEDCSAPQCLGTLPHSRERTSIPLASDPRARLLGSPILRKTARADLQPASHIATFCAWTGLLVLLFAVAAEPVTFPGMGAAYPVMGTALVLYAIHSGKRIAPLEMSSIRYIGLVSYSFYLWHWPLLALAKAATMDPPPLSTNLALCALAFVLAALSYHFVEVPFRRTNPPKVRAIALGVTACVVMAGCAAAVGATTKPGTQWDAHDFPAITGECHFQRFDDPKLPPKSCGDGDVVLWGDSHAYAWRPYADALGPVYQMTRAGCPPSVGGGRHVCKQFAAMALERAKRGKVVILAARWPLYADADIAPVLDELRDVPRVIVMGPLPWMRYPPEKCIRKAQADRCGMPRDVFDRVADPLRESLKQAVALHPNAEYVEPAAYFCTATDCPLMKDGRSLYWDRDHISASAAREFATRRGTPLAE